MANNDIPSPRPIEPPTPDAIETFSRGANKTPQDNVCSADAHDKDSQHDVSMKIGEANKHFVLQVIAAAKRRLIKLNVAYKRFVRLTDRIDGRASLSLDAALTLFTITIIYITRNGPAFPFTKVHLSTLVYTCMWLGDIFVCKPLAITTASPLNDFPALGCGWMFYLRKAMMCGAYGGHLPLPSSEIECKVLNLKSDESRQNRSFLLSRLLSDLESKHSTRTDGLSVEILDAIEPPKPLSWKATVRGNLRTSFVFLTQLATAILAGYPTGDMSVLILFVVLSLMILFIFNLPFWRATKFTTRRDGGNNEMYALMRGQGYRHVFIIRNTHKNTWNLEYLANAIMKPCDCCASLERIILAFVFFGFLSMTIWSFFLSDQPSMFMLFIMIIGTLSNTLTVILPRPAWAHGINLRSIEIIQNEARIVTALEDLDIKYPGLGECLVDEFFPNGIVDDE